MANNFALTVHIHLDDADDKGTWRNALDFDPYMRCVCREGGAGGAGLGGLSHAVAPSSFLLSTRHTTIRYTALQRTHLLTATAACPTLKHS